MMGGRGPIACKFGVQCHRQDCWYSHPGGRLIDGPGRGAGGSGPAGRPAASHMSNGVIRGHANGGSVGGARQGMGGIAAQQSPRMGGAGGGANECRYAYECRRPDCHFSHPFGRAIDGDRGRGAGATAGVGMSGGRPTLNRGPSSSSSMGSITRGMSELSFGSYPPANATDDDQDLRDTWFPKARDCTCCKGYVYGCTTEICESMGQCTCSIEERDLDGYSSVSSASISRTGSPQVGMMPHSNGAMGMTSNGVQPPTPPPAGVDVAAAAVAAAAVAAAAAAAAGATAAGIGVPSARGSRHGSGRAGTQECRYGTGCKRPDCSFGHPLGRSMDVDGVSFGNFGPGGAGGSAAGRGKPAVDQDLMDTWYPDCRECACCKGYKHGCKTPACADAGLCACSSGEGPAVPIADVSAPSSNPAPSIAAQDGPEPPPTTGAVLAPAQTRVTEGQEQGDGGGIATAPPAEPIAASPH